jgi:hypothetical protein
LSISIRQLSGKRPGKGKAHRLIVKTTDRYQPKTELVRKISSAPYKEIDSQGGFRCVQSQAPGQRKDFSPNNTRQQIAIDVRGKQSFLPHDKNVAGRTLSDQSLGIQKHPFVPTAAGPPAWKGYWSR